MTPRFRLSLVLIALFGIATTYSLLVIDLMNLTEEQKKGPVPVKFHDTVRLKCGKLQILRRWVRIRKLDVTFYNLTSMHHKIRKFTMQDDGNYQCRVETYEYREYSNVVLCEAAEDFLKCKSEEQTYRHLIKYGPSDMMERVWEGQKEIRFEYLGLGDSGPSVKASISVPIRNDEELNCGNLTSRIETFYWFVTWKSEWLDLEGYARSWSESTKLMPMHRGKYQCVIKYAEGLSILRTFHVTFKDELLPPSYIEVTSMRELGVLVHDNINISCDIQRNAFRTITWVKSDVCPNSETKIHERKILMEPERTNSRLDTKVLQITELSSKDKGCYTCLAGSGDKTFFQSQQLEIQGVHESFQLTTEITHSATALDDDPSACLVQIVVSILCVVVISFAVIGASIYYLRRSKRGLRRRRSPSPELKVDINLQSCSTTVLYLNDEEEVVQSVKIHSESDNESMEELDREIYADVQCSHWELSSDNLKIDDILREHDFYTLYRARLVGVLSERSINVVVKISKAGTMECDVLALVSEIEIMKSIGRHPNVVNLIGTCIRSDALFSVMEFAEHGNLRDYLREMASALGSEYINETKSDSDRLSTHIELVSCARQVAMGMEYLARQRCVHRDLRAKRVLICDGGILKIADYATKRIRREDLHDGFTFRWMAPETLFRSIYSTEANVWSYGILLWEIMSFAETPYALISTNDELVRQLKFGYYMENPDGCPDDVYKLMKRCWNRNPGQRPQFDRIVEDLDGMLKNLSDQLQRLQYTHFQESDSNQQAEYASTTSEPSCRQNYDNEYAEVTDAIGRSIAPKSIRKHRFSFLANK